MRIVSGARENLIDAQGLYEEMWRVKTIYIYIYYAECCHNKGYLGGNQMSLLVCISEIEIRHLEISPGNRQLNNFLDCDRALLLTKKTLRIFVWWRPAVERRPTLYIIPGYVYKWFRIDRLKFGIWHSGLGSTSPPFGNLKVFGVGSTNLSSSCRIFIIRCTIALQL